MRLTKKTQFGYENESCEITECSDKLGQLEDILEGHNIETLEELDGLLWYVKQIKDIEDELGIDLIILFKALKNGIYEKIKPNKKNRNPEPRFWSYEDLSFGYQWYSNEYEAIQNDTTIYEGHELGLLVSGELLRLEDYGKTWALTKEELGVIK